MLEYYFVRKHFFLMCVFFRRQHLCKRRYPLLITQGLVGLPICSLLKVVQIYDLQPFGGLQIVDLQSSGVAFSTAFGNPSGAPEASLRSPLVVPLASLKGNASRNRRWAKRCFWRTGGCANRRFATTLETLSDPENSTCVTVFCERINACIKTKNKIEARLVKLVNTTDLKFVLPKELSVQVR